MIGIACASVFSRADIIYQTDPLQVPGNGVLSLGTLPIVMSIRPEPPQLVLLGVGQTGRMTGYGNLLNQQVVDLVRAGDATFTSSNPSVALIDAIGNVTAVGVGVSTITIRSIRSIGAQAEALVVVRQGVSVIGIQAINTDFPGGLVFAQFGRSNQLTITGTLSDSSVINLNYLSATQYSVDLATVASVTRSGLVTALDNGTATVKVSYQSLSVSVPVDNNLFVDISTLTVDASSVRVLRSIGETLPIRWMAGLDDFSQIEVSEARFGTAYQTSSSSVATVSADGVVTAVAVGQANITATNRGYSASARIVVSQSPLVSLKLLPSSGTFTVDTVSPRQNLQLQVIGTFADGSTDNLASSSTLTAYTSSDPSVISVAASGKLGINACPAGVLTCSATITSTNGGVSTTGTYTVTSFTPFPVGAIDIPYATNVHVKGNYAYLSTLQGLYVIELLPPSSPKAFTVIGSGGSVDLITPKTFSGGQVLTYTADGYAGFSIYDVTNPTATFQIARYPIPGFATAVAISQDLQTLYVGDNQGIGVYSIAIPTTPVQTGFLAMGKRTAELDVNSSDILVAALVDEVAFIDVSNSSAPTRAGSISIPANGISVDNFSAFVAGGLSGIQVVDFSDPTNPILVAKTNLQMNAMDVATVGGLTFVADNIYVNSLPIFNTRLPRSPAFVGIITFPGDIDGLKVDADNTYVYQLGNDANTSMRRLQIGQYAAGNPTPPTVQLTSPTAGSPAIDGGLVDVSATATDAARVARVDFSVNGIVMASDTAAPYAATVQIPSGFVGKTVTVAAQAYNVFNIASPVSATTVPVVADPLTLVKGRLVDVSGTPIVGASVSLFNDQFTLTSDSAGNFSLANVPSGFGYVTLSATGTVQGSPAFVTTRQPSVPGGITDFGDVLIGVQVTLIGGPTSGTLTAQNSPYLATTSLVVPGGQTLTLGPGTVIKMGPGRDFTVNGILLSQGTTAQPVIITTVHDDSILGDTGKDGPTMIPSGAWNVFDFVSNQASQLAHTEIRHAFSLTTRFQPPHFNSVTFSHIVSGAISIIGMPPTGSNLKALHCGINAARFFYNGIPLGTNIPTRWSNLGIPYYLDSNFDIGPQGSLTIEAGTVIKMKNASIRGGEVDFQGTAAAPISITSWKDDSVGGDTNGDGNASSPSLDDWGGLQLNPINPGTSVKFTNFRYGGGGYGTFGLAPLLLGVGSQTSVPITVDGVQISNSNNTGIIVGGNTPVVIQGSTVTARLAGVAYQGQGGLNLVHNVFDGSQVGVSAASGRATPGIVFQGNLWRNTPGPVIQHLGNVNMTDIGGNIMGPNNDFRAIELVGGWSDPAKMDFSFPFVIRNNSVDTGSNLTMAPGTVLKLLGGFGFRISGQFNAVGVATAPVTITSMNDNSVGGIVTNGLPGPVPGDWSGIQVNNATATFTSVRFRYGGQFQSPAIDMRTSQATFDQCQFEPLGWNALYIEDSAPVLMTNSLVRGATVAMQLGAFFNRLGPITLRNNTFDSNTTAIHFQGSLANLALGNNTFTNHTGPLIQMAPDNLLTNLGGNTFAASNAFRGIELQNGTWNYPGLWDFPLPFVMRDVTVGTGAPLRMAPGTVIKAFGTGRMFAQGPVEALGISSAPVVFTSLNDSSVGGTVIAGSPPPQAGDWQNLTLYGVASSTLSNMQFRYGGSINATGGMLHLTGVSTNVVVNQCSFADSQQQGVQIEFSSHGLFQNCAFQNNGEAGVKLSNNDSGTTFLNNRFDGNAVGIQFEGQASAVRLGGNVWNNTPGPLVKLVSGDLNVIDLGGNRSGVNNLRAGIEVNGFNWSQPTLWNSSLPYIIGGQVFFSASAPLTLAPGTVIKSYFDLNQQAQLSLFGGLTSLGTSTSPVVVTSLRDDSVGGDSNLFEGNVNPAPGDTAPINLFSPVPSTIDFIQFRFGGNTAFTGTESELYIINGSSVKIRDSQFVDSARDGLYASSQSDIQVSSTAFLRNGRYGIQREFGSQLQVQQSIFNGNSTAGITNNDPNTIVDAKSNYWGAASGPTHANNPNGTGDPVGDNIDFVPFLTSPPF